MGIVKGCAICKERKKSAVAVPDLVVDPSGIHGDLHYGWEDRHLSILPFETVEKWCFDKKEQMTAGRFGENLLVSGLDLAVLKKGRKLKITGPARDGSVLLEVVKIGAANQKSDAYKGLKVCVPMEPYFVFCNIIHGGIIHCGDTLEIVSEDEQ